MMKYLTRKPMDYVKGMNHLWSNGPKPKGDTVAQLTALKNWSQNPKKLEKFVKSENPVKDKAYSEPLTKSGLRWNKVTGKVEDKDGSTVSMRDTLTEMQYEDLPTKAELKEEERLEAKKTSDKPKYLNGNVIDITPMISDDWWKIKPKPQEETPDEETINIYEPTVEEKIEQIAHQREMAEEKLFGLNWDFLVQKARERMS